MNYAGKVAIITGASSGIGLEVARRLVREAVRVVLVARSGDALARAAGELGADRAAAIALDVADLDALRELPARAVERFGRIDIVVNNAGVNFRGPLAARTSEELARTVAVNLVAPMTLTRAAIDLMKTGGSIVNVASIAGILPFEDEAAYCASKAGLRAFSRASFEELAKRGLHIGCVSPGPVDTGFFGNIDDVPNLVFSQPMKSAEDIANAVFECIEQRAMEVVVPRASGRLATLAYVFPRVARAVRPILERRGARAKKRYIARRTHKS